MTDFDDIDFEEREREAGVRNEGVGVGGAGKKPDTPGGLDFDDLEF